MACILRGFRNTEEWLRLSCYYKCKQICHSCGSHKDNYMVCNPYRLLEQPRHTHQDFCKKSLKPGKRSFLVVELVLYAQVEDKSCAP